MQSTPVTRIPYYAWNTRGATEMSVRMPVCWKAQTAMGANGKRIPVILDTDIGGDTDDTRARHGSETDGGPT